MYVRELVVSYRRRRIQATSESRLLSTPSTAASVLLAILQEEAVEVFGVLFLTAKQTLLGYHQLSRGGLDSTIVRPREVFQVALLANAATLIVGHNHPSGDPNPSPEDLRLTRRLIDAGALMGIHVIDHIIVGYDGRYFSFKETGEMRCT